MSYYNVILLSCASALFILALMRLRETFQEKQAMAIAEMEKSEQEKLPDSIVSIFSGGGDTFEGAVTLAELNRLRRVDIASRRLIVSNQKQIVERFAQLERAVKS